MYKDPTLLKNGVVVKSEPSGRKSENFVVKKNCKHVGYINLYFSLKKAMWKFFPWHLKEFFWISLPHVTLILGSPSSIQNFVDHFESTFLTIFLLVNHNFDFWPKFRFLTKISMFDQNFDFSQKFRFLTKISIFARAVVYP